MVAKVDFTDYIIIGYRCYYYYQWRLLVGGSHLVVKLISLAKRGDEDVAVVIVLNECIQIKMEMDVFSKNWKWRSSFIMFSFSLSRIYMLMEEKEILIQNWRSSWPVVNNECSWLLFLWKLCVVIVHQKMKEFVYIIVHLYCSSMMRWLIGYPRMSR